MVDNTIRLSASDLACDDGYDSSWSVVKSHPPVPATDRDVSDALDFCDDEDLEDDCAPSSLAVPPVNFGEIVIQDSTDVHIGNKTFYNGSVTIKQFVISKDEESKLGRLPPTPTSNGTLARSCSHLCEPTKDENQKEQNKLRYLKSPYTIGGIIIMLLVCTLLTVYLVTGFTANVEVAGDPPLPPNSTMRIVRRSEWNASRPARPSSPLQEVPVPYVIIEQTGGRFCPEKRRTCATEVKNLQGARIYNHYYDIQYNFLVGGDGQVYEGVGWYTAGFSAETLSLHAVCVAFIGDFETRLPGVKQLNATLDLIQEGVKVLRIAPDYKLVFIGDAVPDNNGGAQIARLIRDWPQWSVCDSRCKHLVAQKRKLV